MASIISPAERLALAAVVLASNGHPPERDGEGLRMALAVVDDVTKTPGQNLDQVAAEVYARASGTPRPADTW